MHLFIVLCAMAWARPDFIHGTPKSLREAIQKAIQNHLYYPAAAGGGLEDAIERSVGEFIAQRFSVQALKHRPCEDVLIETYNLIRQKARPPTGPFNI